MTNFFYFGKLDINLFFHLYFLCVFPSIKIKNKKNEKLMRKKKKKTVFDTARLSKMDPSVVELLITSTC